jgi:flagellar hook protein FlgE
MMRSLFSGVSGLRNHQTAMDVIGNNIANVNTVGFKASRVNFEDVLSQTLQNASSPQGTRGGTNPMQVGLGMGVASIDTLFTDGSFQSTGSPTDLAIAGQGFFVLSNGTDNVYTRAGNFNFDSQGNFLSSGGYPVLGWMADASGNINTNQPVGTLTVPVDTAMAPKVSSTITYSGNLSGSAAVGTEVATAIDVYDAQGNKYVLNAAFEKTAANTWSLTPNATITTTDASGATVTVGNVAVGTATSVKFNADGSLDTTSVAGSFTITPAGPFAGAAAFTVTPDISALTQYGSGDSTDTSSTAKALESDGYPSGTLTGKVIDSNGIISGKFSNGRQQVLGQVAMAVFSNPGGLDKIGDNLYTTSNNSGNAQIGTVNTGGRGALNPGSLEMSNVDLAEQFSEMIVTQRGFEANSKIISVSDEMLQTLANLKR